MTQDEPLFFASAAKWEAWLEAHHAESAGVTVAIAKKGGRKPGPSRAEALDVALCFGWIDGQARSLDDDIYLQRFTPRRPRSMWSQVNRAKVEALIAAGRMRPAGLAEIERAKADGRWAAAYAPSSRAEVPEDLQAALDANPTAAANFAKLDRQNRYALIFRTTTAKRSETRARRIARFVEMLAKGETIYPTKAASKRQQA